MNGSKLIPSNDKQRIECEEFIKWFFTDLGPYLFKLLGAPEGTRRNEYTQHLNKTFLMLEEKLISANAPKPYFLENMSIVDVMCFPWLERFQIVLNYYRNYGIPGDCSRSREWYEKLKEHPSIAPTCQSPEILIEAYRKFAPK
eukprot:TRINITY_DN1811_c2_g1_i1.p1 TRINITY_DN1811_c2_g1~~TRINITY_DN1811_c2_g1_i1.p1  ORF type:complete len:143 (-),score=6.64 TRINITY_DN1811_c2_g1_i1:80-508(-)